MSGKIFPSSIPAVGSSVITRKSSSPSNANTGNIQNQVSGSEVRPGSYAAPPNTIGLPTTPSPLPSTSSSTSSSKSQASKVQQPISGIPKINMSTNGLKSPIPQQLRGQAPPPPLKLKQESISNITNNNGLLSTIEQAAHSDEEPTSPPALPSSSTKETMFPATSRSIISSPQRTSGIPVAPSSRVSIPSRSGTASPQPNYENVSTPTTKLSAGAGHSPGISKLGSPLGQNRLESNVGFKSNLQNPNGDRISTAQFVASNKRDIASNHSFGAKKSYLPQAADYARFPSPKVSSAAINSSYKNPPSSSTPRLQATNPTVLNSTSSTPTNIVSPVGVRNTAIISSRIPMPK